MENAHLKLINKSRYFADGGYKYNITNDNVTRSYAKNADFYSLALTTIRILGKHCHGTDSLCFMSKRIVSLQDNYFTLEEQQAFVNWEFEKIEHTLTSYWRRIQGIIVHYNIYVRSDVDSNNPFISTLNKWLKIK